MRIECEIYQIMISDTLTAQRIVLKEKAGDRMFPIFIGPMEIAAIDRGLNDRLSPRPLTHDLCLNIMEKLGGTLRSICINDLRDNIFFADLEIETEHGPVTIDCRPSDALALSVKTHAPIFVEENVIREAAV